MFSDSYGEFPRLRGKIGRASLGKRVIKPKRIAHGVEPASVQRPFRDVVVDLLRNGVVQALEAHFGAFELPRREHDAAQVGLPRIFSADGVYSVGDDGGDCAHTGIAFAACLAFYKSCKQFGIAHTTIIYAEKISCVKPVANRPNKCYNRKMEIFSRTRLLLGDDAVKKLNESYVVVFGLGGVGGHLVEALARSGVGRFLLVDGDVVTESNINRQIIALHSTIGKPKTEVMKARLLDINPNIEVETRNMFYLPENADEVDFSGADYVADAVDTVSAKIEIIARAIAANIPVISCMGAGNRTEADFVVRDIYSTVGCPLARVMRRELKKRGITSLKTVCARSPAENSRPQGRAIGSAAYVTAVAGLTAAAEIINEIIGKTKN